MNPNFEPWLSIILVIFLHGQNLIHFYHVLGFVDDNEINQLSDGFFADLRLQDQDRIQTVLDQAAKAVEKDEVRGHPQTICGSRIR